MDNWIDYKKYRFYEKLENLRDTVITEYNEINNTLDIENESLKLQDRYGGSGNNKELEGLRWFSFPILDDEEYQDKFAAIWPKTTSAVQDTPGAMNATLNFIGPYGTIPDHVDHDLVNSLTEKVGVGNIIGIDMPTHDTDLVGFHVDNEVRGWSTGDIVSFDGYKVHGGWNQTDQWRVSMIIDIDKTYYNL